MNISVYNGLGVLIAAVYRSRAVYYRSLVSQLAWECAMVGLHRYKAGVYGGYTGQHLNKSGDY